MTRLTEDFLRPFGPLQVTQLLTLAMEMETYGLTAADVVAACTEYMGNLRVEMEARPVPPGINRAMPTKKLTQRQPISLIKCPECGAPVGVSPVNVSKCTQVGGGWHTSLVCANPKCRFTELSIKTVEQWRENNA